jgi:hypothetical protein
MYFDPTWGYPYPNALFSRAVCFTKGLDSNVSDMTPDCMAYRAEAPVTVISFGQYFLDERCGVVVLELGGFPAESR